MDENTFLDLMAEFEEKFEKDTPKLDTIRLRMQVDLYSALEELIVELLETASLLRTSRELLNTKMAWSSPSDIAKIMQSTGKTLEVGMRLFTSIMGIPDSPSQLQEQLTRDSVPSANKSLFLSLPPDSRERIRTAITEILANDQNQTE